MTTPHEADIVNADRQRQAGMLQEHLAKMGVQTSISHYTGDSSYPTEYRLTHGSIWAIGPTMDLAVLEFIEKLLESDAFKAYQAMEAALQLLSGNIMNMRTELLAVKALVEEVRERQGL